MTRPRLLDLFCGAGGCSGTPPDNQRPFIAYAILFAVFVIGIVLMVIEVTGRA